MRDGERKREGCDRKRGEISEIDEGDGVRRECEIGKEKHMVDEMESYE